MRSVRTVKQRQIDEAEQTVAALQESRNVMQARLDYYTNLLKTPLNTFELAHLAALRQSQIFQLGQIEAEVMAAVVHLIPELKIGAPTTIGSSIGGENIAGGIQAFGSSMGAMAGLAGTTGSLASAAGGFQRRQEEWAFQKTVAAGELEQIRKQILGAQIRLDIAEKDLANHDKQVDNASAMDDFLRSKSTNQPLYDWLVAQISATYFEAYKRALYLARQAERAFQFELADWDSSFIQFGYWDNLKKGLLAGERLHSDLRRMEAAYLGQNKLELEALGRFSLAEMAPMALLTLKQTGQCFIEIPERLYDRDYPGVYCRRINKTVAITLPCITGPYVGVNCTLTLVSDRVRIDPSTARGYPDSGPDDDRFRQNLVPMQSIVTTTGQNDSGHEPLDDGRYPFAHRAGAISQWLIEVPRETNRFPLESISDVILFIHYTARYGGAELKKVAMKATLDAVPLDPISKPISLGPGISLFSMRSDMSNDWYRFLRQPDDGKPQTLSLDLSENRFPYHLAEKKMSIQSITLILELALGMAYDPQDPLSVSLVAPNGTATADQSFQNMVDSRGRLVQVTFAGGEALPGWAIVVKNVPKALQLKGNGSRIDNSVLVNGYMLCAVSSQ